MPKDILKNIAYWVLPRGMSELLAKVRPLPASEKRALALSKENIRHKDIHKGKRCFILCNGPSVNRQDLLPLKDEIVFSVSNGYHHKDYNSIRPIYHCTPQLTYTDLFTKDTAFEWFREMDNALAREAELFFNYSEEKVIRENDLFKDRKVNFMYMKDNFKDNQTEITDITGAVPSPQSVPVMCLMIAMYMEFKEIYLIGTDHDSFRTGEYKYFYRPTLLAGKDLSVADDGKIKSLYNELRASANLWHQYRILRNIAEENNIKIYNATLGGALDEFERVDLHEVLNKQS